MKKLALPLSAVLFLAGLMAWVQAQQFSMPPPAGVTVMGCVYNASPPTLTTANAGMIQCDSAGKLISSGSFTGAVTIADGADVTQGAKADAACSTGTGTCTVVALLKWFNSAIAALNVAGSAAPTNGTVVQCLTQTTYTVPANGNVGPVPCPGSGGVGVTDNHIGEVGGNIIVITNAMTTSNNAISAGESIGGIQTLAGAARVSGTLGNPGTGGLIQSIRLSFKDATAETSMDVWFFNAALAGATCADNTNFTLADGDRPKVIGIAHLTDENGTTTATTAPTFLQANNLAMPFSLSSATSILACVVNRGASITPADTSGATLQVTILRQ